MGKVVAKALFCMQIFGKNDTHVPPEGRDLIRKTLHEKGVLFSFYEVAWAQRKFSLFLPPVSKRTQRY
jgi:dienelactone hydrolase